MTDCKRHLPGGKLTYESIEITAQPRGKKSPRKFSDEALHQHTLLLKADKVEGAMDHQPSNFPKEGSGSQLNESN